MNKLFQMIASVLVFVVTMLGASLPASANLNCAPGTERALKKGETLSGIAKECWGDYRVWPLIYIQTNARRPGSIVDPNWVAIGAIVVMPTPPPVASKAASARRMIAKVREYDRKVYKQFLAKKSVPPPYLAASDLAINPAADEVAAVPATPGSAPAPVNAATAPAQPAPPLAVKIDTTPAIDAEPEKVVVVAGQHISIDQHTSEAPLRPDTVSSDWPYGKPADKEKIYGEIVNSLWEESRDGTTTTTTAVVLLRLAEEFRCRRDYSLGCNENQDDFQTFFVPRIVELMQMDKLVRSPNRMARLSVEQRVRLFSRRDRLLEEVGGRAILHPDATGAPPRTMVSSLRH